MRWTGPTGRSWLSPAQHPAPAPPVRPLPAVAPPDPLDELSPFELERHLAALGLLPDDDTTTEPPVDAEPDEPDLLGDRITHTDTRWTLDLRDPYRWLEPSRSVDEA